MKVKTGFEGYDLGWVRGNFDNTALFHINYGRYVHYRQLEIREH